jgi:hypothetical protein
MAILVNEVTVPRLCWDTRAPWCELGQRERDVYRPLDVECIIVA